MGTHAFSALQVARRVKVLQPDTPNLKVRRVKGTAAENKVASGMEVAYSVTYTPDSLDHFNYDLVVCTEREKFLVPCTVTGSKAALDFPDHLEFAMTPAKCSSSQACLVTNVGSIAADFTLTAYPPFHAEPARAQLPPGDTMQCSVQYTPRSPGIAQWQRCEQKADDTQRLNCKFLQCKKAGPGCWVKSCLCEKCLLPVCPMFAR